jgi:hypothetical protein
VLLVLTSPNALSEPLGAGALRSIPFATKFLLGPDVSFRGEAEVSRAPAPTASVENDPKATSARH